MRIVLLSVAIAVLFSVSSQAQTRRETLEKFTAIQQRIEADKLELARLEQSILLPDKEDIIAAERENARVFRILPREKYDQGFFKVRGGGAFYSFIKESHSYDDTPQIGFEQNYLMVGFYGASYGFLTDLGVADLAKIDAKNKGVMFLANYRPPLDEPTARVEQKKARGFEFESVSYKNRLPAIVGNSYILRAVSYGEADTLVALKVHRRDADGSLIIFWRLLGNFEKPMLARK